MYTFYGVKFTSTSSRDRQDSFMLMNDKFPANIFTVAEVLHILFYMN